MWSSSLDVLAEALALLGSQLEEIGDLHGASKTYLEALALLREQGKTNPQKRQMYGVALGLSTNIDLYSKEYELALSKWKEALQIFRDLAPTQPISRQMLPLTLKSTGLNYFFFAVAKSRNDLHLLAQGYLQEAVAVWRSYPKSQQSDLEIAQVLWFQSQSYSETGQTQKSLNSKAEAIKILRELAKSSVDGKEALAFQLKDLGNSYMISKDTKSAYSPYAEAAELYRDLIVVRPGLKAKLASVLNDLRFLLLYERGETELALKTALESVQIFRELNASDLEGIASFASSLSGLASIYSNLDQTEKALEIRKEAVALRRRAVEALKSGQQIISYARVLNLDLKLEAYHHRFLILDLSLLSSNLSVLGKKEEALSATQEALLLARRLAKNSPDDRELLAGQLIKLSYRYSDAGQFQSALDASLEAVQIMRNMNPSTAEGRDQLGDALYELSLRYSALGRRQEALAASREAMALRQEQPLTDSFKKSQLAESQSIVAYNLTNLGQPKEAAMLAQNVVQMFRQSELKQNSQKYDLAIGLTLLSFHYSQSGDFRDALPVAEESLQIIRDLAKLKPSYSDAAAIPLIVIGLSQYNLGKPELALSNTQEAIRLLRKPSKTDLSKRAGLAFALNHLSQFQAETGRNHQALQAAKESVAILRNLSTKTPEVLDQLSKSTTTLATLTLRSGQPTAAIPLLQEAVTSDVRFLQQQLPLMPEGRRQALVDTLGRRWEIPYSLAQQGEAGASLALYTRLNRHGPLQDIERRQALISRSSGATQTLVNRLTILNGQISNPTLTAQAHQSALAQSEKLQEELHRQQPALQPRLVEIADVARQLPADGVLVEFQRFSPYNAAKPEKEAWGKPRYLALVLDRRGSPRAVDLGEADALEQAIAFALDRTRFQQPGAEDAWALVAEKLFSPLRGALEGKRQLLVSPDGQLHRVPFSALALLAGNSAALPTSLSLQTIGSGRDLVPVISPTLASSPPPATAPLVLADPQTTGWDPLVRAASEGQSVAAALGTQPHLGKTATVALLEQTRGPRLVHVAGHGYFDPQASGDPLLASGLALAGANKARLPSRPPSPAATGSSPAPEASPADDGYLTAKEAARLQLDGTTLVVLSACESGLGRERTGEGLFGLRRALTVAGARGTLLSLWKVPEHASEAFMTRLYALLGQGLPPAEAVRRVQAEFRAQPRLDGWSDPFYWAGWQYSGLPDPVR